MPVLIFDADDVRRVVGHTLRSTQAEIADWSTATEANGWTPTRHAPSEPNVLLVHDDGVYLMSNGHPADLISGDQKKGRSFCAYARGCHPKRDPGFYEAARELVGGDDFVEYLPWARAIKAQLDAGARQIEIEIGPDQLELREKVGRTVN